jgi:hypothetical protein
MIFPGRAGILPQTRSDHLSATSAPTSMELA